MRTATACTRTWSAKPAPSSLNCNRRDLSARINFVSGQVAQLVERSPEKAGVGGSIPSLATTFSSSYTHPEHSVCSILFLFQIQACRNLPHHKMDRTGVYPPRN